MRRIAVLGLGYAGLPVAVAFAGRGVAQAVVGFDVDLERVEALAAGRDPSGQVSAEELRAVRALWTADPADLQGCDLFVVCVPTPIDADARPDLGPLRSACELIGTAMRAGAAVVVQSTVYPGATEELCVPLLEHTSGLKAGSDFHLAFAPERINPGDPEHGLAGVVKLVAAPNPDLRAELCGLYEAVVPAGVVPLDSIRVAETAKLLENVQRDLNIALMNELAVFCDRLGIDTREVVDAAATKWNFHRFHPGLVGGHCVGVDPYYLTAKAAELGLETEVVLAGRRTNNRMGTFVAERTLALCAEAGAPPAPKIAVLGAAFKPGVGDPRNSRVPELVEALRRGGADVRVHEPVVEPELLRAETGLEHAPADALAGASAIVLATPHPGLGDLALRLARAEGASVLVDVLGALDPAAVPAGVRLWRL